MPAWPAEPEVRSRTASSSASIGMKTADLCRKFAVQLAERAQAGLENTRADFRATVPQRRWSLDFVAGQFIDGRRMGILTVPHRSQA